MGSVDAMMCNFCEIYVDQVLHSFHLSASDPVDPVRSWKAWDDPPRNVLTHTVPISTKPERSANRLASCLAKGTIFNMFENIQAF